MQLIYLLKYLSPGIILCRTVALQKVFTNFRIDIRIPFPISFWMSVLPFDSVGCLKNAFCLFIPWKDANLRPEKENKVPNAAFLSSLSISIQVNFTSLTLPFSFVAKSGLLQAKSSRITAQSNLEVRSYKKSHGPIKVLNCIKTVRGQAPKRSRN